VGESFFKIGNENCMFWQISMDITPTLWIESNYEEHGWIEKGWYILKWNGNRKFCYKLQRIARIGTFEKECFE